MIGGFNSGEEEKKEVGEQGEEQKEYEILDQGFWRNLISKLGNAELSHCRFRFNPVSEFKKCAFTADEKSLMVITQTGEYYKLPV